MTPVRKVYIREVGPREGFQIEDRVYPTEEKARLIEALAGTGLAEIQVASFVRGDLVPQMADAEQLVDRLRVFPGVRYTATYLNVKGYERAMATGKLDLDNNLTMDASETFSQRNTNATLAEKFKRLQSWVGTFGDLGIKSVVLGVSSAFGCNFEGDIPLSRILETLRRLSGLAGENNLQVKLIRLLDTMGWANPVQIHKTAEAVRQEWPGIPISLHLHDTRGMAIANAYAGLMAGVEYYDNSVGGLGGCPFAGIKGAAGNIATEEFVLLCHELGIETGVDLDALVDCVRMAEEILGRRLPGKLTTGGTLDSYRRRAVKAG